MFSIKEYQAEVARLQAILEWHGIDKERLFADPKMSPLENFQKAMLERSKK